MVTCPRCRASYADGTQQCPEDGAALLPSEAFVAADEPLKPSAMVGEYRVARKLGSGTFGDVYAGEQPLIGKRVAIKILNQKFSADPEMVSRFIAEARAVNRIRHRNIIDVFSFGLLDERRHYFVMELLDGMTLRELLDREGRLSVARALPILRGIADALDAAHEAGVTHRDLKPDNVFLAAEKDGSYFPKLLDFGVAKLASDDVAHKTATGIAIGTPRYMSPEQSRGKKVDHRSDIYALGVVIHEVLTGQPPFGGDSSMDVLLRHATEPPPPMSGVRADLPPELDEPVLAMLAKRPNARPSSAGKAVADLAERARTCAPPAAALASSVRRPSLSPRSEEVSGEAPTLPATSKSLPPLVAPGDARAADTATVVEGRARAPEVPATDVRSVSANPPAAADEPPRAELATSTVVVPMSSASGTLIRGAAAPAHVDTPPVAATLPAGHDAARARPADRDPAPAMATIPARPATAAPPRARSTWLIAAAAIGGLALGVIAVMRSMLAPAPTTPSATPEAPAGSITATAASEVTVRLTVSPSSAEVRIDDRRVGSASDPLVLPRSDKSLALRLEKDGYEPQTLWVTPDRDRELPPVVLARSAPAAAPPGGIPSAGGAGTSSANQPSQPPRPKHHVDLERPPELGGGR